MTVKPVEIGDPRRSDDRGANLVEMALILPLLLVLLVGVADVGRAFFTYISLTNAAREGVRFASQFPFSGNEAVITELVLARARGEPASDGFPWEDLQVQIDGLGTELEPARNGEPITVTVSQGYNVLLGGVRGADGTPVFPPITIRSYATMIIFGVDGSTPGA